MTTIAPLQGVRIIEASMLGPAAITQNLVDLGAEVIKVEPPQGDYGREMTWPIIEGTSLLFLHANRGKKGIVLDLRTDEGVEAFRDLVRNADAVVEAMRPGALARRGLGFEDLKKINPKIVFMTISGYGMTGPYKDLPSHGIAYDTWAGIVPPAYDEDGFCYIPEHTSVGINAGPVLGAMGILAGIIQARATGEGCQMEIAQSDAAVATDWLRSETWKAYERPEDVVTGNKADNYERRAPGTGGMKEGVRYQMYESADGHVLFMASEQAFWKKFCDSRRPARAVREVARLEVRRPRPGQQGAAARAPGHLPHQDHQGVDGLGDRERRPAGPGQHAQDPGRRPAVQGPLPVALPRDPRRRHAPVAHQGHRRRAARAGHRPRDRPAHRRGAARRRRLRRRPHRRAAREGRLRLSHIGDPGPLPVDPTEIQEGRAPSVLRIVGRVVLLGIAAFTLYVLLPQLLDLWDTVPRLRTLSALWFVAMVVLESGSYMSMWALTRVALPTVSWFVAGTSQLVSNAVSKTVPGGAAMGAATGWRMLSVSGVEKGSAGAALTATAIISNGVLFMLPMVALLLSIVSAPVPRGLDRVAWGGAVLFILLFAVGFALVRFDRPLIMLGNALEQVSTPILRRLHRPGGPTADGLVRQRDLMVEGLGARWKKALAAAVGNWLLDYMALVAALMAVGVKPRFSVVLLAYGAAAVLGMIPITPGGLGFVEAGLTAMLVLAGVPSADALLATLAYRIVSYWLPLPAGVVAHFLFRHRYGGPTGATVTLRDIAATFRHAEREMSVFSLTFSMVSRVSASDRPRG